MPDTQQSKDQQSTYPEGSQAQFDRSFIEQMSQGGSSSLGGIDVTAQVVTAYFDQVEQTTRQARRMADLWAQSLILQQTTQEISRIVAPQVARQVVSYLKSNPQELRELVNR